MGSGKKKTRQMRTELQFLTLRQRHTTEDLVLKQRLFDLKEVLLVEVNPNPRKLSWYPEPGAFNPNSYALNPEAISPETH